MAQFYDAIIIGSGPAGLTAALYLGRAGQKCIVLEKDFVGGYTAKIAHIENYPGYETINGMDLTQIMAKQAEKFGATIVYPVEVVDMELKGEVEARADPRRGLRSPCRDHRHRRGAERSWRCPAPRSSSARAFPTAPPATAISSRGRNVAVVGSDDEAAEEALHLADLAAKVTIVPHKELDIVTAVMNRLKVQAERRDPAGLEDPFGRGRRARDGPQDLQERRRDRCCRLRAFHRHGFHAHFAADPEGRRPDR